MRASVALALFATLAAAGPLCAETLYDCSFPGSEEKSWIQPRLYVVMDAAGTAVKVSDAIIYGVTGKPWLDAALEANASDSFRMSWSVTSKDDRNQRVTMEYRLEIGKADGSAALTAQPAGYDNRFFDRGTCTIKTVKRK